MYMSILGLGRLVEIMNGPILTSQLNCINFVNQLYVIYVIYVLLVCLICDICQDLPQQTDDSKTPSSGIQEPEQKALPADQSMKIAWRYQNQPKFEVSFCCASADISLANPNTGELKYLESKWANQNSPNCKIITLGIKAKITISVFQSQRTM